MDATIKARWVEALRSGKYKQGRGHLRRLNKKKRHDEWCCLGVLCDILRPGEWKKSGDWDCWTMECHQSLLPDDILADTGLYPSEQTPLVDMNDSDPQASFSVIADWIEANL